MLDRFTNSCLSLTVANLGTGKFSVHQTGRCEGQHSPTVDWLGMSVSEVSGELLLALLSPDEAERERGADEIADSTWQGEEAVLLCRVLVRSLLSETNNQTREAQLNALGSLAFSVSVASEMGEVFRSAIHDPDGHLETLREALEQQEGKLEFDMPE
jgi:hypothetical protein